MDRIGELRHRIEIIQLTTAIDSDYGGEGDPTPTTLATVWASWNPKEARSEEKVLSGQKDDVLTVNFGIRYRGDVTSGMLVKYENLYYNILSVLPDTKRMYEMLETQHLGSSWDKGIS